MISARVLAIWTVRLLLAVLFFLGSEVLVWGELLTYDALDWAIRLVGYPLLAILVLDVAVRYRIRAVYDVMMVCGIYALLTALLITPEFSFVRFPDSLLTRVLGGHGLVGLEMFGLWLILFNGRVVRERIRLLLTATWLGFYWGVWMRWNPELSGLFAPVPLVTMIAIPATVFVVAMVLWRVSLRLLSDHQPLDWRLSRVGWLLLLGALIVLFLVQGIRGTLSVGAVIAVGLLLTVCWGVLWFRREPDIPMLLDSRIPPTPLRSFWFVPALLMFTGTAFLGYTLPLVEVGDYNQLWLMEIGFGIVGTIWFPLVAIVISTRGIDYLMRTNQLS